MKTDKIDENYHTHENKVNKGNDVTCFPSITDIWKASDILVLKMAVLTFHSQERLLLDKVRHL